MVRTTDELANSEPAVTVRVHRAEDVVRRLRSSLQLVQQVLHYGSVGSLVLRNNICLSTCLNKCLNIRQNTCLDTCLRRCLEHISEHMSKHRSERISERMSEHVSKHSSIGGTCRLLTGLLLNVHNLLELRHWLQLLSYLGQHWPENCTQPALKTVHTGP